MGRKSPKKSGRQYMCTSCNTKHSAPTGRRCPYTATQEQDDVLAEEYDVVHAPPRDTPDDSLSNISEDEERSGGGLHDTVAALTSTVTDLVREVAALKTANSPRAVAGNPAASAARPERDQSSVIPDVSLATLRRMQPLNSRVDALMEPLVPAAVHAASDGKSCVKSPRDAPTRRIIRSILWPNQMVTRLGGAGASLRYDELTLPEFVLGSVKIVRLPELPPGEISARLSHLDSVMTLARHYTWPSVRSLYGAVLEDVQYGSSDWSVSVVGYRDALLTPMNLLAAPTTRGEPDETSMARTRKPGVGEYTQSCRKFNWETCHRSPCPYLHICSSCMRYHGSRESHKAKECARRAEFLNTQRQAATPGTPNISGSGSGTSNGGSF